MSDKKKPCVVVLIGNDDEEVEEEEKDDDEEEDEDGEKDDEEEDGMERKVELARACAQRLYDVLNHTKMFSGHPLCSDPILLLDKSKEEIMEGIREAVQLVKETGASWLAIYYAGHSSWHPNYNEIVIEPKAGGGGMKLEMQVKLTVQKAELEYIKTIIFVDSCLTRDKAEDEATDEAEDEATDAAEDEATDEAEDEAKDEAEDAKKLRGNTFLLVRSCEYRDSVRDGYLFARAIERCARKELVLQNLRQHVEELAWQLSFGRLCPWRCLEELEELDDMVLAEEQRELFISTHFLHFALDLWTEKKLERDTQTEDSLEPGDSVIDKIVEILREIAKEFETKQAAFEDPWCELEAIAHCDSLEGFLEYLKKDLKTPRTCVLIPENVSIPDNIRGAIVEVLQEKIRDPRFKMDDFYNLRYLVQDIRKWYEKWEGKKPIPPETGTWTCTYSLVMKGLDVKDLPESDRKRVAEEINQLCKDFGIRGRVYLVPGSLWIIFCTNERLSRDCRSNFAASLKSWIHQQKQSGANGWTLAQDPCWKPLYAVPDRILDLVRQVETLCGSCLPTKCMWLRASDLRNLVAMQLKLEEWRVVVFEGLVERRGDSWLQGTGTLGCCFMPHFEDERLEHRMQEVANLACKRKQSMRPEVQALVFLLQRAQLKLTDEEWTQVVDSARVCYERLKTVLRKVMPDKDLIIMNDIVDDSDWKLVDFAMSDMPPCVVVLIGNNDEEVEEEEEKDDDEEEEDENEEDDEEEVKLACACAQRLCDVLNHSRMFSGHPVCGDPILLLDKSKEEIMEGIREAVQRVKEKGASWLAIYYAGPSFWTFGSFGDKIVIEPKANGGGMSLEKQVKQTVHKAELKRVIKTTIFVDGCLKFNKEQGRDEAEDESEDEDRLGDSKKLPRNEDFKLVCSCEIGGSARDGCLFARAIERCARESLDQEGLVKHVQELAKQLSCGRLCPWSKCPEVPDYMVLSTTQQDMGLFEQTHFLRFALDLWAENELDKVLALDPQRKDKPGPEGLDIDEVVKILKSIVKELEAKKAAFEDPWCELEAIAHCDSLEGFLEYLKKDLKTPRTRVLIPENVSIPDNIRGAIVEVLQEKIRDPRFKMDDFYNLRYLVQDIRKWYEKWEGKKPIPPETGTWTCTYSLVMKGLDVKDLPESDRKRVAEEINQLCEDLDIPGRVYLVPG